MKTVSKGNQYEILSHLPPYGPMYIPVAEDGEGYYSEGFVVRFIRKDGTDWVANFKPGWTDLSFVKEFREYNRVLVIANGQGYLMSPDSEKPVKVFGITLREVIPLNDEQVIASDNCGIQIINHTGVIWESPRISWDGIRELQLERNILYGKSYHPTSDADEWIDFSIDLETKTVKGGSFGQTTNSNGKAWWKIWK